MQIKAQSFGSVIDHMNPGDVEGVLLPPIDKSTGKRVGEGWTKLAEANAIMAAARDELENALRQRAGEAPGGEVETLIQEASA